jgi:hypothetical protein
VIALAGLMMAAPALAQPNAAGRRPAPAAVGPGKAAPVPGKGAPGNAGPKAGPGNAGPKAGPGGKGGPAIEAKRQRVRERLMAMRASQLTATLGLDEQTAVRLTATLGRWDQKLAAVRKNGQQARQQLRVELAKPAPDAARVNQLVDTLLAQQRAAWSIQEERFKELRGLMTPAQSARLLVQLPEIDRRIKRQIQQAMRRGKAARAGLGKPGQPNPGGGQLVDPFARRGQGKANGQGKGRRRPPMGDPDLPDIQDPF